MFYVILLFGALHIAASMMGYQLEEVSPSLHFVVLAAPIILVIAHACITLSPGRAFFFLLFAAAIGFISEYLGLKYGQLFGTFYTYKPQPALFTVPVQVLFYWAAFSFLELGIRKKPSQQLSKEE